MPVPLTHGDHSCKAASAGGEHVNWNKKNKKMGGKSGRWEESRIMLNSDAGRQKQSGGNRMLSDRACWNIHHPVLLVLPSYLPFQSVLCPPVSHPLGQPDPLQLSRGFLKVPNASLAKVSFFPWLAGWLIPCLDLPSSPPPTPLPLSAVCKEEKGDVCNRTLIPVSYAVENCWWCCWQRERALARLQTCLMHRPGTTRKCTDQPLHQWDAEVCTCVWQFVTCCFIPLGRMLIFLINTIHIRDFYCTNWIAKIIAWPQICRPSV